MMMMMMIMLDSAISLQGVKIIVDPSVRISAPIAVVDFIFILKKIKKNQIKHSAHFHASDKQNVGDEDFSEGLTKV